MKLIGSRKKKQNVPQQVLGYVPLVLKGLVAQRVARNAYKGYKWTRRLPFLVAGAAVVAFVVRKAMQKTGGSADAGFTPSTPEASPAPAPSAPASTPSTPTPTGAPTAVTPAPTAAADGAPDTGTKGPGATDAGTTGEDGEPKG